MNTGSKGIALIKSFEGCRLTAYKCPTGVWTIGYGHTAGVKQGQTITQTQAEAFLKEDLVRYEKYVANTGLILNQNQFDALVSFSYNCGVGNLKKLVNNRTLPEIAEALLLYNKSSGKVLAGLVRRREAERALFLQEAEVSAEEKTEYIEEKADEKTEDYIMVKPVDYKQSDSKWGSLSYAVDGESSTIKSAGCGPTVMADILASIVSPFIDPVTCASWARMKGYKVLKSGTSYNYPVAQAAHYGVTVRRLNTSNVYGKSGNSVHEQVLAELKKGNWIIACMGKGLWTSSGHYIVVYGYKDGYVYINDPASSKADRACNTFDLFKSQVKYYWAVDVPEEVKKNGIVTDGEYRNKDFYREVQMCIGAGIDEIPGKQTLSRTVTVSESKNRKHVVVLPLQKRFKKFGYYTGSLDRIAGKLLTTAVKAYQAKVLGYIKPDGEVTAKGKTWKKLLEIT